MRASPVHIFLTTDGLLESELFRYRRELRSVLGCEIVPARPPSFAPPYCAENALTWVNDFGFWHVRSRLRRSLNISVRPAKSEAVVLLVSLRGKSRLMQDGREIEIGPGDSAFHDTTRPAIFTMDEDHELICFEVPRRIWLRRVGPTEQITARAVRGNTPLGRLTVQFFRELIPNIKSMEPATADRMAEASLVLADAVADNFPRDVSRNSGRLSLLGRAKTLVDEKLYDPSLNPEKIARGLRISERYLQDLFHEEGTTVSNWIWRRRVEKCRQSLSDPLLANKTVSEIAFSCGFSDLAHFSRRFKATFTISPSDFRRQQLVAKPQEHDLSPVVTGGAE